MTQSQMTEEDYLEATADAVEELRRISGASRAALDRIERRHRPQLDGPRIPQPHAAKRRRQAARRARKANR